MDVKRPLDKRHIAVIVCLVLIIMAMAFFLLFQRRPTAIDEDETLRIGYAAEAKVMLNQDSLQAAFDAAMQNAAEGNIGLKYKNDAYSTDGTNFECYIANSEANIYDMFLTIFANSELTDQIFLSGLVPPGSGFENITLERSLDPGDHLVYVALTQVETDEETGEQAIMHQVVHTMDFHVTQ